MMTSSFSESQNPTPESFVTPTENKRGDGLLPIPTLVITFRSVEAPQQFTNPENKADSPTQKLDSPGRVMELPIYDGQNPDDWVFRAEKCFAVNHVAEEDRLGQALACLTGSAVTWLRYTQDMEDLKDWKYFKDKLKKD